jgi:glutathione S-transferase
LTLNYKKLPYNTHWIRVGEIESTLRPLGFEPSWYLDGQGVWTVPSLTDPSPPTNPSTPFLITESRKIAEYLDYTYPSTPPLFPSLSTRKGGLHENIISLFEAELVPAFAHICIPPMHLILGGESEAAFQYRWAPIYFQNQILSQVYRKPEERVEVWDSLHNGMDKISKIMDDIAVEFRTTAGDDEWGPYVFGKDVSYADILMLAFFMCSAAVPADRDEGISRPWDVVKNWHGGRWERMVQTFDRDHGIQEPRITFQRDIPTPHHGEVQSQEAHL